MTALRRLLILLAVSQTTACGGDNMHCPPGSVLTGVHRTAGGRWESECTVPPPKCVCGAPLGTRGTLDAWGRFVPAGGAR